MVVVDECEYRDCPYHYTTMHMRGEEDMEREDWCRLGHPCIAAYGDRCEEFEKMKEGK